MKIVIGIPIYKQRLGIFEKISLQQVDYVLKNYEKVFIVPISLKFDYDVSYKVERFPDEYFQKEETYSRLLLSVEFYQRFIEFDYLLIYQLDAFVFSDRLVEFCSYGFDYIGAPVKGGDWNTLACRVGNGGLSLRKVSTTLQLLNTEKDTLHDKRFEKLFYKGEDLFFSYCGAREDIEYRVPSVRLAACFSVEFDIAHGYRDIKKRGLPFGCHWWHRLNYHIWKPIIEGYGYILPPISFVQYSNTLLIDYRKRLDYCLVRSLRNPQEELLHSLFRVLDKNRPYSIWGAGKDGKKIINILKHIPVIMRHIYDIQGGQGKFLEGIPITIPVDQKLLKRDSMIIIATSKYAQEIQSHLELIGLKKDIDFCLSEELRVQMQRAYLKFIAR